jgi:two-component system cell cycle response regulator CpdR
LGEEVQTEPVTISAPPASNCRARILCADDDPALRTGFAQVLTRAGYSVTTVADGLEAWESLQSEPYDLLITDNEMPGFSGIELVVQARLARMALPIVVATSDVSSFTDPHMQWLRIAALLQKPFGLRTLSNAVGQALCAAHQVRWGHDEGAGFRCRSAGVHFWRLAVEHAARCERRNRSIYESNINAAVARPVLPGGGAHACSTKTFRLDGGVREWRTRAHAIAPAQTPAAA